MEEDTVNDSENDESSDCETTTAERVLEKLKIAWLNEKFAPEILCHRFDLVDCMLEQIFVMEKNIKKLKKGDIRFAIHKMEIDRIRFILASYMRTRLEKIEQYTIHILSEEAQRSPEDGYLTPGELKFAKEYLASIETLFKTVALQHMPNNFQEFEINNLKIEPNLQSYVFLRAIKEVKVLMPDIETEELVLEVGSQHVVKYQPIAGLLKEGKVRLI